MKDRFTKWPIQYTYSRLKHSEWNKSEILLWWQATVIGIGTWNWGAFISRTPEMKINLSPTHSFIKINPNVKIDFEYLNLFVKV